MGIVRHLTEAPGLLVCPSRGARPHKTGPGAMGVHNPHNHRQKKEEIHIIIDKKKKRKKNEKETISEEEKGKKGQDIYFLPAIVCVKGNCFLKI